MTTHNTFQAYGGTTASTGWLMCQGQAVSRTEYADLFNAIGTNYGVSGSTFNLLTLTQCKQDYTVTDTSITLQAWVRKGDIITLTSNILTSTDWADKFFAQTGLLAYNDNFD